MDVDRPDDPGGRGEGGAQGEGVADRGAELRRGCPEDRGRGGVGSSPGQERPALAAGARTFARASDRQVRIVLGAGLAAVTGHLVETQFSFQTTTTATLFWLTLGILVAPWAKKALPKVSVLNRRRETRCRGRRLKAELGLYQVARCRCQRGCQYDALPAI